MPIILKANNITFNDGTTRSSAFAGNKAIFGYGQNAALYGNLSTTNIVSTTGVVATDITAVGTPRYNLAAASYGGDKAIFGLGKISDFVVTSVTNLVNNGGIISTDTTNAGITARDGPAAASYGGDKAIFGFGFRYDGNGYSNITNLVSNVGVVAADVTNASANARAFLAAASYGGDKAIFGFGFDPFTGNGNRITNLVSNVGVVAANITQAAAANSRYQLAATSYGGDKAIFGFGYNNNTFELKVTNLITNTGTVASAITSVGTARFGLAAASYDGDKAIFGFGQDSYYSLNTTNLVSNVGVVASDTTGVGTARSGLAAASFRSG
jgi:hypothetical protein